MTFQANTPAGLVHLVTQDCAGVSRARSIPGQRLPKILNRGLGWCAANVAINPFGNIVENQWGALGDVLILPDAASEVVVSGNGASSALHYFLCDLVSLDGSPWEACPRQYLKRQIKVLAELGVTVVASFEHEFMLLDIENPATSFSLAGAREEEAFCTAVAEAMLEAKLEPEMCIPEYAPRQYEVTVQPADALRAADRAIHVREIVREIGRRQGRHVSFAPVVTENHGTNGVHIHFSLWSDSGQPLTYDPAGRGQLSELAGHFCAGVLTHMPALTALTAPGVVSYQRLRPQSWSAAYVCIGQQNRDASLRIAPLSQLPGSNLAHQANIEYRAADALASPYMALGALLSAGIDGIKRHLPLPELVNSDPGSISITDRVRYALKELPSTLEAALNELEQDEYTCASLGRQLLDCYRSVKASEIQSMKDKDENAIRSAYSAVY